MILIGPTMTDDYVLKSDRNGHEVGRIKRRDLLDLLLRHMRAPIEGEPLTYANAEQADGPNLEVWDLDADEEVKRCVEVDTVAGVAYCYQPVGMSVTKRLGRFEIRRRADV